jgi:hypothetical protein
MFYFIVVSEILLINNSQFRSFLHLDFDLHPLNLNLCLQLLLCHSESSPLNMQLFLHYILDHGQMHMALWKKFEDVIE